MTQDQTVLLAVGGLTLVCFGLVVALARMWAAGRYAAAELEGLRQRLGELEEALAVVAEPAPPATAPAEFVITDLGVPKPATEAVPLDRQAFADLVLRETVVKAASLVHGVRRGLAPATRNRIRFEMRQEVRRAHKQRRADLKATQRDLHARQRADMAKEAS